METLLTFTREYPMWAAVLLTAALVAVPAVLGAILDVCNPGTPLFKAIPAPEKRNTRKEDLARFTRGEIGIQEYLDLHSGQPEDGSLAREKKIQVGLSPLEGRIFDAVVQSTERELMLDYLPCTKSSHPGRRVAKDRVVRGNSGFLQVWQPVSNRWALLENYRYTTHPCCPDFYWFTEINGKRID